MSGERANDREPTSIRDAERKFGGCARKAVELISGDLLHVSAFETEGEAIHSDRAAEVSSGHVWSLGGASPLPILMEEKCLKWDRPALPSPLV